MGKYTPGATKTLMDRHALAFGEEHPDMRIVIFNPSMILGNESFPFRTIDYLEKTDSLTYWKYVTQRKFLLQAPCFIRKCTAL